MRGEWLKKLGKEENWVPFFDEYALFKREDVAVQCYAMQGHQLLDDAYITAQAKALWLSNLELPSSCNPLFDRLQQADKLTNDDIWARVRLALQAGKLGVAKSVVARLQGFEPDNFKLLDRAYQSPQLFLEKKIVSFKTRFGAEANLYALDRLARNQIETAISTYQKVQNMLEPDNRAFGWGRVAYHAARSHHPQAVSYYYLADGAQLDEDVYKRQILTPEKRFAGREGPLRLLVVGGSLGAQALNEVIPQAIAKLPLEKRPQVIHQAGVKHIDTLKNNYEKASVLVDAKAFIDDMAGMYAWADFVICRAGALTVAEVSAVGLGSLMVPFPFAVDDHQTTNAAYLAEGGAAIVIQQKELSADKMAQILNDLNREKCLDMAIKARALGRPEATESVATICIEVAR